MQVERPSKRNECADHDSEHSEPSLMTTECGEHRTGVPW